MITNSQIKKLEHLLDETGLDHMPVDVLQGFLAATAIGPNAIPPNQWMPVIFFENERVPRIEGNVNPDLLMKALFDFYNSTLFEIQSYEFDPVITTYEKDGEEFEDVSGWCRGFITGLGFWGDDWKKKSEPDEIISMVVPIVYMADIEEFKPDFETNVVDILQQNREELEAELPLLISDIWSFWAEKRTQTPVRAERIGRNDPCPCGSGKKYKKCCGT